MPKGYLQIPDWFPLENQGGNIAVADLNGNGLPDLVVVMVDNPPGRNRGLFRVGRDLDAGGNPTGGWTGWFEVPDWFSFENQGAGIALGDVNGDGKQDLVVLMIDSPPGKNQGFYRIGKALDQNGNVAGGWMGSLQVWCGIRRRLPHTIFSIQIRSLPSLGTILSTSFAAATLSCRMAGYSPPAALQVIAPFAEGTTLRHLMHRPSNGRLSSPWLMGVGIPA